MKIDAVILGGGVAGLWLLDEIVRQNYSAILLEAFELGSGQTVASQGIIHGGLKYSLKGKLTSSAKNISEMPSIWRKCLQGEREPNLSSVKLRSQYCHLWRTNSLRSKLGMFGARFGLRVLPEAISFDQRPKVLKHCPGEVTLLKEQVLSPESLVKFFLKKHHNRILKIDADKGVNWETSSIGHVKKIVLCNTNHQSKMQMEPVRTIFTAGAGNATLREQVGLSGEKMQRRPLQMVMVRGNLPILNGHCVDGMKTRITITTDEDSNGRTVWQVGGQLAETGVSMVETELIKLAKNELKETLPGMEFDGLEWTTYCVDRAEGATAAGLRPDTVQILQEGNTITAWPTKLVLAPVLAEEICKLVASNAPVNSDTNIVEFFKDWLRPNVAPPPWETAAKWFSRDGFEVHRKNVA